MCDNFLELIPTPELFSLIPISRFNSCKVIWFPRMPEGALNTSPTTDLQAMKAPRMLVKLPTKNRGGRRNETEDNEAEEEEETQDENGRAKREAKDELRIETAVFVDDEMVTFIKERYTNEDVKDTITDTVFSIMNGVTFRPVCPCSVRPVVSPSLFAITVF